MNVVVAPTAQPMLSAAPSEGIANNYGQAAEQGVEHRKFPQRLIEKEESRIDH